MTVNVSSKGDACIICDGKYPFPSKEIMGIYLDRQEYPHKFICCECMHWVSERLNTHLRSNSYNFLFLRDIEKGEGK